MRRALPVFYLLLATSSTAWPASISVVGRLTREMTLRPGGIRGRGMKRLHCLAVVLTVWAFITLTGTCAWGTLGDITATGNWSETIDASDLIGGAGSDLTSTYESASAQTSITITNTQNNVDDWRVDVRRADTTWHGNFTLSVQRTGDGTGGGSISGGVSYQAVGTTDASFFSGAGDRTGITVQLKLDGMSVQVPINTYSTTVTFTVVDT